MKLNFTENIIWCRYSDFFYIFAALIRNSRSLGYIGLMDRSGNNTDYRWISDNTNLTFNNFAPDEPDSSGEHCVAATLGSANFEPPGLWHDVTCMYAFHAICETNRVSENFW